MEDDLRNDLRQQGWVVLGGLLDCDTLERAAAEARQVLGPAVEGSCPPSFDPDRWPAGQVEMSFPFDSKAAPTLNHLSISPVLLEAAGRLMCGGMGTTTVRLVEAILQPLRGEAAATTGAGDASAAEPPWSSHDTSQLVSCCAADGQPDAISMVVPLVDTEGTDAGLSVLAKPDACGDKTIALHPQLGSAVCLQLDTRYRDLPVRTGMWRILR